MKPSPVLDALRKRLGMPEDHPRLHELQAWVETWLPDSYRNAERFTPEQLPEAARQALISAISVPESWFWRYPAQLQRVVERVRSLPANAAPLEIWSACCAGGEEPYTLLLMLEACGLADRVRIVATDINPDKLRQAQDGVYSARAVRQIPESIRRKAFTQQGYHYVLSAAYRDRIRFDRLDLLAFAAGQVQAPLPRPDVILCRNALIYFDRHHQTAITDAFLRLTRPGAWLLLGHSERLPLTRDVSGPCWQLITAADHTLYEHVRPVAGQPVTAPARHTVTGPRAVPQNRDGARPAASPVPAPARPVTVNGESPPPHLKARAFLTEAQHTQDPEATIALCRKALYLIPDLPEAHWLLWKAARRAGHDALAGRHARLLRKWLDSLAQPTMLKVEPPVSSEEVSAALTDEGSGK